MGFCFVFFKKTLKRGRSFFPRRGVYGEVPGAPGNWASRMGKEKAVWSQVPLALMPLLPKCPALRRPRCPRRMPGLGLCSSRAGGRQWIQFPPSPALESVPDRFLSRVASSPRSTSLKRQQATGLSAETTRPVPTGDHPCPLPPGRARGWRPAAQAWGSPSALGGRGELVFH